MFRLKLDQILESKPDWTMYKLHIQTGIRPNTISDMVNNKAKQWSPENLNKIYKALGLESVNDLIEYVDEAEQEEK
ncbi:MULTISPECIES: helix-turn-helix domain-containing protein [Paenibacillus]|uniref:helix-turn-helix domain-containing protein n=1 Tax=Paenibacillus TaxID=44249 RepID=UPI00096DABEB|nr:MULTISPECIES: helix-turn-helix transcriptional regulator [Paenibacillus]MDY8095836.1 helix-turn-helix transcriptional regulator [Paenibacillus polymyxa]OMF79852.1 hypothetical protein BK145_12935 [Paenibacillus peoriae]